MGGELCDVFEEETSNGAGMGRGAAADEPDGGGFLELFSERFKLNLLLVDSAEHRLLDGGGLFKDLFEQVMGGGVATRVNHTPL